MLAGFWSAALFFLLTGLAKCDVIQSVTYVTIASGGLGMALTGHLVALLDVSGPYAGSAMGFVNTVGTLGGIIAPYVVAVLTEIQVRSHGDGDVLVWYMVFYDCSEINTNKQNSLNISYHYFVRILSFHGGGRGRGVEGAQLVTPGPRPLHHLICMRMTINVDMLVDCNKCRRDHIICP